MATLNQALYNRSPFNIGQTNTVIWVNADAYEFIESSVGVSEKIYLYPTGNERVRADVYCTRTIASISVEGGDQVGYNVDLVGQFWFDRYINEKISLEAVPSRRAFFSGDIVETRQVEISYGRSYHIPRLPSVDETLDFSAMPYYEIWLNGSFNELVSSVASVEAMEEMATMLSITLKPNDVLVIDANNFTVLLNGENVVNVHSGEWLTDLNRNTVALTIHANSGENNLSASVSYTERYL